MHKNANEGLKGGTELILTIVLLSFMIAWFNRGTIFLAITGKKIDTIQQAVSSSDFTKYDNTTVHGSEVINAISLYAKDKFTVKVETADDSTGVVYDTPNSYKITDLTDKDYIDPTANFHSELVKNANKTVTQILFTPGSGTSVSNFGTATTSQVLNGYSFTSNNGLQTGTMTDNTGKGIVLTPGTSDLAVPEGYTDGNLNSIKVAGDANLIPGNILAGKTIFGVTGTASGSGIFDVSKYINFKIPTNCFIIGANSEGIWVKNSSTSVVSVYNPTTSVFIRQVTAPSTQFGTPSGYYPAEVHGDYIIWTGELSSNLYYVLTDTYGTVKFCNFDPYRITNNPYAVIIAQDRIWLWEYWTFNSSNGMDLMSMDFKGNVLSRTTNVPFPGNIVLANGGILYTANMGSEFYYISNDGTKSTLTINNSLLNSN